jgi:type II secretory pathway pseudopilin PulG
MALLTLLPCANVIMLLYLFFAPTRDAEAEQVLATANTVPVLIAILAIPCVIGGIGIIAAIAIPSLLRARVSTNESMAIGDIRTVISGEAAYQSNNSEHYDTLACLAAPKQCIPNYPPNGPTFIDPSLASAEVKGGYRRSFHAGPAPSQRPGGVSPSSIESYAYVAVPVTQGQTGVRSFCGDSSGLIWFDPNGKVPQVVDGRCDESWTPLR